MAKHYYVYVLASGRNGTLYIGVTGDLLRRVFEHKEGVVSGFTQTHKVHHLVYFEQFDDPTNAIRREKTMKGWPRQWKLNQVEENNPMWRDLYEEIAKP